MVSKWRLWRDLSWEIFRSRHRLLRVSQRLSEEGQALIPRIGLVERSKAVLETLGDHLTPLVALHSMVLAHVDAVRILASLAHGLEATANLRAQVEAALTLMHLIQPGDDLQQVLLRCDSYLDWVMIKMYMNARKSREFALYKPFLTAGTYAASVDANYKTVCEKYADRPQELKRLARATSFVPDKLEAAKLLGIGGLYSHIYAEASATIHLADVSDRTATLSNGQQVLKLFRIRNRGAGFWPLFCSTIVMTAELKALATFLGLEHTLRLNGLGLGKLG